MKKTITNVVRYALVSLFSFLFIGSALAATDENGLAPKHWYAFNGSLTSFGATALSIQGENDSSYFDGVHGKAYKVQDGSRHPYGSGVQYGNGAWSIVTVAKAAFKGSNATVFWATGITSDWFGLLAADANTVKVAYGNGGGITESEPLTATVSDTTAYHVYVIVYDGSGGLSLYVDGVLGASKTGYTPKTNGSFQWGAVQQGVPSGIARVTDTGLDDWRLYQQALTEAQIQKITSTFVNKETPKVIAVNFNGDGNKAVASGDSFIPGYAIPAAAWANTSRERGSSSVAVYDTATGAATGGSATVTWACNTVWDIDDAGGSYFNDTVGFMRGYLDDGTYDGVAGVTITANNIPFEKYDVLVFSETDGTGKTFRQITVTDGSGSQVLGADGWGSSLQIAPMEGVNYLRAIARSGDLTIQAQPRDGDKRGCIVAVVLIESTKSVSELTATISREQNDWSKIEWQGDKDADIVTYKLTLDGATELTMDETVDGSKCTIVGNNNALTVKNAENLSDMFLMNGVGAQTFEYDCKTASLTADNTLKNFIKSAGDNVRFVFLGNGNNGATMDFVGNDTFNTHIVFDGGTHVFKRSNGGAGTAFANNGTAENPSILVKDGATLNLYGKDFCGWNAAANPNGVVRVNSGAILNLRDYTDGTFFFSARLYLDAGSNTHVYNSGNHLRINGGNVAEKEQIYVPASENGVATITIENNANMYVGAENNPNAGFYVGEGSTLKIVGELKGVDANRVLGKRGAGKLEITGNVAPGLTVDDGSLALGGTVNSVTLTKATEIEVASGTATISAISGEYAITKTGAGTLSLPASYTGAITLSGGLVPGDIASTVTINDDIDLGTTVMPLGWTLDTASTGSLTLPTGFAFGQIVKASAIPEKLTFKDSAGATIASEKLEIADGYITLKKSEINVPYDISGPTQVDELAFGASGSIVLVNAGASLTASGTISLSESGLPIVFTCDKEYVLGDTITLVTASAFKVGEADATNDKFTFTGTFLKGMNGTLALADNDDGTKSLVCTITKSDYYTEAVAEILEDPSLIRRFDASRGVTTDANGKVIAWADICGTAAAAAYSTANITDTPTFVNGELREYLDFGACNSHIDLGFEPVDNNAKTVIEVIDLKNDGRAWLMGDRQVYNFHRDQSAAGSTKCFNNNAVAFSVRDNGADAGDGKSYVLPEGFRVVSMTTSENCSTDCFSGDRGGADNRSGGRKLSEVLIFNTVLTADQLKTVEDYLTAKWNLALKNEATISGAKAWSDLTWKAGKFYADVATEITLEGNTVLTYDAAAPVGNITFVKGDYTLEQVVTSATGLSGNFTVPSGETFVFKGGDNSDNTFTFSNAITVNGTLKTEGYVNLNANNTVPGGTLEVVNGQATLKFAGQGVNNGGTLTIDAGATAVAASGDALHYNGNDCTLNVYGTLDMGGNRWTIMNKAVFNLYAGANVTGTGDTNGALDMHVGLNAKAETGKTTVTINAPFKFTDNVTFDVADGVTLNVTAAVKSNQTKTLTKTGAGTLEIGASQGNVTVAANAGKVVLDNASYVKSVSTSGTGSVEIAGGEYDVGYVRDFSTIGNITTSGEGKIKVVAAAADDGTVKIVNVPADIAVALYDADGTTPLTFDRTEGMITATCLIKVDGAACYYDWTFTNTVQTTGAKGIPTSTYSKNQATLTGDSDTSYADQNEEGLYTSLYISVRPYLNLNWNNVGKPMTVALACKMSEYPNTELIALGNQSKCFFFATTEIPNEVQLVYGTQTTDNQHHKCEVITTMSVPAASTAFHVYEITLSADGKTVTVYLDGIEWASSYKAEGFGMNNGLQMGGWFQGNYENDGFYRDGDGGRTDTSKIGRVKMLRVYNSILGPNSMAKLSEEFPYNPQFGAYSRTLDEAIETWSATEAWTDDEGQQADIPVDGSVANLTVGVNSELTINADEEIHQESITIVEQNNGSQTLRIKADTGEIINDGATIITTPVTIEYGAMTIAGGPTKINGNGSVTFDFSNYPIETVFSEGHLGLTGLCDAPEGEDKSTWPVKLIVPEDLKGRKMTLEYTANNKYELVYGFERDEAGTLYLTESATLSDTTLFATEEGGEAWMPRLFAGDIIVVPAGVTMTIPTAALEIPLTTPIQGAGTIAVTDATLTEESPLFTVAEDWAGAVEFTDTTVNGADLNKYGNENTTVKLAGVAGYLKNSVEFKPEVILENTATLAGLELTDGSSGSTVIFNKVSGTGNLIGNNDTVTQRIAVGDASGHVGHVRAYGGMGITLGSEENTAGNAAIAVADGATIAFEGQTWIAAGGVTFGETLTVIGEVDGFIAMPEPTTALPAITLAGNNRDYMLKYAEGNLTVAYAEVTFTVPEIAGATASIEGGTLTEGTATVAYDANATITYTADNGKFFDGGSTTLIVPLENITDAAVAELAIAAEIEGKSTVDAGAKIGENYYLDIDRALLVAEGGQTVVVLKDAALDSLVVPTGVTLDLNNKLVGANAIENNGTIVIYDAATAVAFVNNDIAGVIKFGANIIITCGDIGGFPTELDDMMVYVFPQGGTFEIIPPTDMGQTALNLTLPTGGFAVDMIGLEAKKNMSVVWAGNSPDNEFVLAGEICRGSRVDTRVLVAENGKTIIAGSIIVGCDSVNPNIDYTTYQNGKATLEIQGEFTTDALLGEPSVTLIPERGELVTFAPIEAYGLPVKTVEGAEVMVESQYINELYTRYVYTAEWIYPEAKVEATTVDGFDAAYIYTAANDAPHYDTETASFVLTANKAIPADAVMIGGKFSTMDWNIYNLPALEANTEYKVTEATWSQVKAISPFTCGAASIALTEDTEITLTLKLGDEVIDTKVVSLKAISVLPTASVAEDAAEGYEAVVKFTADNIGAGYNDWNAKFILIPNVAIGADKIKLGGSYTAWQEGAWIDLEFPACEANEEIDVLGLGNIENITVNDVFNTIQSFKCGVKNIGLKNDATFTLKLVITDGETTKEICSIDNLKVEAKTIEPVDPEEPQTYDDDTKAAEAAAEMNGENGTIKPEFINAPEGFDGNKAAYAALFAAVAEGNTVTVKLTVDAEKEIKEDLAKPENAATILTPDENGEATIAAKPGLFYGIVAEGSLDALATAKGQNWVMATGNTVKVEVPTVTDTAGNKAKAAFFRPTCAVKMPVAE